jgi:hypothetical protein
MVLEQVDTLVATGRSIGRGETGHLSVGFCTSISAGNLRTTLLDFRTRFPRIELAIAERPRTLLMNALGAEHSTFSSLRATRHHRTTRRSGSGANASSLHCLRITLWRRATRFIGPIFATKPYY